MDPGKLPPAEAPMPTGATTTELGHPADRGFVTWTLLALLLVPLLAGAFVNYPTWDDGMFWFQTNENGPDIFRHVQGPDRPVMGWIWATCARLGVIWPFSVALYVFTWAGTGLLAGAYWRRLFPELRSLTPVIACLAVSPILIQTQLVLFNPVISGHFGSVVSYAACLMVSRPNLDSRRRFAMSAGACALVLAVCLISEYALLATIVASVALALGAAPRSDRRERARLRRALVPLNIAALIAYGIYHAVASAAARPEVRPEIQLAAQGMRRLLELPIRVPFSLWAATVGELFHGLGSILFFSGSVWGIPFGLALAALAFFALRRRVARDGDATLVSHTSLALLLALTLGTAAVTLMTSSPQRNIASRVWQPLFPPALCLTGVLLFTIVQRRYRLAVGVICVFLSGYLCANAAATAWQIRKATDRLAPRIQEQLAPTGLTVAVFVHYPTNPFIGDPVARAYELSARLSRTWPEQDRRKLVAAAYDWPPFKALFSNLPGVCGTITSTDVAAGGWIRKGPVARLLWVSRTPDGEFRIEGSATPAAAGALP